MTLASRSFGTALVLVACAAGSAIAADTDKGSAAAPATAACSIDGSGFFNGRPFRGGTAAGMYGQIFFAGGGVGRVHGE